MREKLLIFLHGHAGNGRRLAAIGRLWSGSGSGGLRYASPDAAQACEHETGFQWFSIQGITPDNRLQRVMAARAGFDAVLKRILHEQGYSERLQDVILFGFSQGTIMALDGVVSGRWPVGAVIGFAGMLLSPDSARTAGRSRIMLIHGDADPVIDASASLIAHAALQRMGHDCSVHVLPGVQHSIDTEGLQLAHGLVLDLMSETEQLDKLSLV